MVSSKVIVRLPSGMAKRQNKAIQMLRAFWD